MAATIVITCPKCKKQLKAPAELQGKKIRCKECQTVIPVQAQNEEPAAPVKPAEEGAIFALKEDDAPKAPAKKPAPPPPKKPAQKPAEEEEEEGSSPYGVTHTEEVARCPNCAKEMEDAEAIICLHCGYNTRSRTRAQTRRVRDITPEDRLKWMMPGVACVLGVLLLAGFDAFFCFGLQETWDGMDEALGAKSFSMGIRVWVVSFTAWVMWRLGKFAFKRLILQPTPPEEEIKK